MLDIIFRFIFLPFVFVAVFIKEFLLMMSRVFKSTYNFLVTKVD